MLIAPRAASNTLMQPYVDPLEEIRRKQAEDMIPHVPLGSRAFGDGPNMTVPDYANTPNQTGLKIAPRKPPSLTPSPDTPVSTTIPDPMPSQIKPQLPTAYPGMISSPMPEQPTAVAPPAVPSSKPTLTSDDLAAAELEEAETRQVTPDNSRGMSAILSALYAVGEEFARNPASDWQGIMRGLGAAGAGAIVGGVRPDTDEYYRKQADIQHATQKVDRGLKIRSRRADVRSKEATAKYNEERPALERRKIEVRELIAKEAARLKAKGMSDTQAYREASLKLRERGIISLDEYRGERILDYDLDREQKDEHFGKTMRFREDQQKSLDRQRGISNKFRERSLQLMKERNDITREKMSVGDAESRAQSEVYAEMAGEVDQQVEDLYNKTAEEDRDDEFYSVVGRLEREARGYKAKAGVQSAKGGGSGISAERAAKMTEEQIRAQARSLNVDEEYMVEKWRKLHGKPKW